MRSLWTVAVALVMTTPALAEVKTKKIEYKHGDKTFVGHLAWDDAVTGKRPGVLVVHEWWGLNDYAKKRAEELAKLGYIAFACDMYGEGKVAEHPMDANKMASDVRKNLADWQGRAAAALKVLTDSEYTDGTRLAAMGYCFGGSTALQLASTGADLKAVVTFHAALPKFTETDAKKIRAKVLVCHGKEDFFIKEEAIADFKKALADAKIALDFQSYEGAVHSFTVPDADKHNIKGMGYNKAADEKSWSAMMALFADVFKK